MYKMFERFAKRTMGRPASQQQLEPIVARSTLRCLLIDIGQAWEALEPSSA